VFASNIRETNLKVPQTTYNVNIISNCIREPDTITCTVQTCIHAYPVARLSKARTKVTDEKPNNNENGKSDYETDDYRVGQKKTAPNFSSNNFGKYGPI